MLKTICDYFFEFMLFSVGGWVMETVLYLIRDKAAVKRGFLFGPVCPIYGFAAVICDALIYKNIKYLYPDNFIVNILLIFVIGFVISFLLEYLTHWALEKIFHAMWWDYSARRFNLKGRVYLNGLAIFGLGVVLIVKLLLPAVYKLIGIIPLKAFYVICFILYSVVLVDFVSTVFDLKGTIRSLKNLQASAIEGTQKGVDLTTEQLEEFKKNIVQSETYKKIISENPVIDRIKKKYPNLKINTKWIKLIFFNNPVEGKERTDIKLYGTAETAPKKDGEEDEQ